MSDRAADGASERAGGYGELPDSVPATATLVFDGY